MKKLICILFLSSILFSCFSSSNNQKELSTQDYLKKQLLGNSVTGALACCMTASLTCVPVAVSIVVINLLIAGGRSIKDSVPNINRRSLGLIAFCSGVSLMRYNSAYVIPYLSGFLLSSLIAKRIPGFEAA